MLGIWRYLTCIFRTLIEYYGISLSLNWFSQKNGQVGAHSQQLMHLEFKSWSLECASHLSTEFLSWRILPQDVAVHLARAQLDELCRWSHELQPLASEVKCAIPRSAAYIEPQQCDTAGFLPLKTALPLSPLLRVWQVFPVPQLLPFQADRPQYLLHWDHTWEFPQHELASGTHSPSEVAQLALELLLPAGQEPWSLRQDAATWSPLGFARDYACVALLFVISEIELITVKERILVACFIHIELSKFVCLILCNMSYYYN